MGNKNASRAKPTELQSHWPKLIERVQISPQDFYAKVEKALSERHVPDIQTSRVDWKEGGPLSARREYLRVTRQRLTFDICGAPFGTGFFVSLWFGHKPLRLGLLSLIALIGAWMALKEYFFGRSTELGYLLWQLLGLSQYQVSMILAMIALACAAIVVIRVGSNLDDFLINTPIVGYFYERFFRKITLYRIDLTCMYQAAVHAAVVQVIDEITKSQGIAPLSELERRPIFLELTNKRPAYVRN